MSLFGAPPQPAQAITEDARHFIEKIAVGHGYIAAETLAAMPPDVRRLVEEALKKDTKSSPEASQSVPIMTYMSFQQTSNLCTDSSKHWLQRTSTLPMSYCPTQTAMSISEQSRRTKPRECLLWCVMTEYSSRATRMVSRKAISRLFATSTKAPRAGVWDTWGSQAWGSSLCSPSPPRSI